VHATSPPAAGATATPPRNSAASANRSAGFFAIARATTRASGSFTVGASDPSGGGAAVRWSDSSATRLSAVKGRRPASISNSITPQA
jgi:hypothetical protein